MSIQVQKYFNFLSRLYVVCFFTVCLSVNPAIAQECGINFSGTLDDIAVVQKDFDKSSCDTLKLKSQLDRSINSLFSQGYLLASYSLEKHDSGSYNINIFSGPKYKWASLSAGNVPEVVLTKIGFREKFYANNPFRIDELNRLFKRLIKNGEQEGFPFVSVKLDSVKILNSQISAVLKLDRGVRITYDSIKIKSDFNIKPSWLASYLGIEQGGLYNQSAVDNLENKLNRLNFLELVELPTVTFQNEEALVSLNLKKKSTNRADGIIGFLPNEEQEGQLLVTGEFDLSLDNLFNSGKELNIKWQSLKARSQFLNFDYYHRNLFRSRLDFSSSFQILKEDTLFINREGEISFNFNPSKHGFELFTKLRSSRLLSTEQFREVTELPEIADFNLDYYGIIYSYNNGRILSFRKRYFNAQVELAVGSKRVRRNNGIPAELYNTIDLRSVQYNLNSSYEFNLPLGKNFAFYQKISGGKIINETLFLNDLYRIGGLNTLRGYNENFFFASDYALSNSELRLYFQERSYLFTFYDQSYLYYDIDTSEFEDYPLGLGLGLNLATKKGLVSLAYAIGKSRDQPLSLSLSKFHFGYVTKF